jgi:cell division protein FtsA
MAKAKDNLLTAVDVGSAKTVAIMAEITDGGLRYRAHGISPSRGSRRGIIVDLDKAAASVQKAVAKVEAMAEAPVERAVVGVAGPHIRGVNSHATITLGAAPKDITRADVRQALEQCRSVSLPPDRVVLHLLQQDFKVDDQAGIHDPEGMRASRLEARVHLVTAASGPAQNVVTALNLASIEVEDNAYEARAAADAVLRGDERELGVCLADIGAGTTDLIVFHESVVVHTGVVPLGGDHFTNDIAVGLRTPLADAENIKRMFGCAVVTRIPEANEIEVPSVGDRPSRMMSQRLLGEIIEPRARELFELIRDHLRQAGVLDLCGTGFVLTGGGARLPALIDVVDSVVHMPARVGLPSPIPKMPAELAEPEFATAIGLLLYGYLTRMTRAKPEPGAMSKLKALFARAKN